MRNNAAGGSAGRVWSQTLPWILNFRASPWRRWGMMAALLALALWGRFEVDSKLPPGFPFLTFFPAIILSAFLCGRAPAAVCSVLSLLAAWYWFIPPKYSFMLSSQSAVAVVFFACIAVVDVIVIDTMTSALGRLRDEQQRTQTLLQERNVLFSELQHRVANTLTLVSTMLAAKQRQYKHNPEAAEALKVARRRLDLLSGIHRRMHHPDQSRVPIQKMLQDLGSDFERLQDQPRIRCGVRCDDVDLPLDDRITLALLTLELMTNSVKHAFTGLDEGRLDIALDRDGSHAVLSVSDNGIGMSLASADREDASPDRPSVAPEASSGLGSKIVQGLASALRGQLNAENVPTGGTRMVVRFPLPVASH